jgi:hypothetical protein
MRARSGGLAEGVIHRYGDCYDALHLFVKSAGYGLAQPALRGDAPIVTFASYYLDFVLEPVV